jgi:hypothetical protein
MDTSLGGRVKHALGKATPIGAEQFAAGGKQGLAGMAGYPIYGKSGDQVRTERLQKVLEQYKKAHGIQ